ncbi:MAG: transporter [Bacteroidaceae bacterium]|nr:transporter [Bacteroidaceae bacterium]
MRIVNFIKNWSLPISMISGVAAYFIYVNIHALDWTHTFMNRIVSGYIQPTLIFCMLFVSFCKVSPKQLKPRKWMLWSLLIQIGSFTALGMIIAANPSTQYKAIIESAMLCLICPTATAASVVTSRLQGNSSAVVSYTCLINLAASLIVPAIVPLLHDTHNDLTFIIAFLTILHKIFPTLIFPLLLAFTLEFAAPKVHAKIKSFKNLSFNLWIVSLAIAIAVTVRAIVHTEESVLTLLAIALTSLVCCLIQFVIGHAIGVHYNDTIAGTQTLGQKNTVFAIWTGATFLNPVTATAGGFYSIWHNIVNSYQLYKKRKEARQSQNS